MAVREREQLVLNVYGEDRIETVENAIEMAKADGAESDSEAVVAIAGAYTGVRLDE